MKADLHKVLVPRLCSSSDADFLIIRSVFGTDQPDLNTDLTSDAIGSMQDKFWIGALDECTGVFQVSAPFGAASMES